MNPRNVFRAYQGLLVERQLRADSHRYTHLAIGFRTDGAVVLSFNNTDKVTRTWSSHAEARVSKKLDVHSSVYVMRLHKNQDWALSAPCESCLRCMIRKGVSKVYFTTGPDSYGTTRV